MTDQPATDQISTDQISPDQTEYSLPSLSATLPQLTDRLQLGTSALRVSPYCLGMIDDPEAVPAAFEAGINFFFITADMHWPLYAHTRAGLELLLHRQPEARDQIVVAVVAYVTQPEFCIAPFEEVVECVDGLGHLDVAIAGGAYESNMPQRMQVLAELRRQQFLGIRAVGASFHARQAASDWLNSDQLDIGFVRYNPAHMGAHQDLFPNLSPDRRSLIYGFKSMSAFEHREYYGVDEEYWMPEPTDHYRFVLSTSPLQGILCSPSTPQEIDELTRATASGPLSADQCEHMIVLAQL